MAKKNNLQTTLTHWAYQNKKTGSKISEVMKSVNELSKQLNEKRKTK